MNPNAETRFTCRVVRWSAAVLGTSPARHCAACEECAAFFAADGELENALRAQAPQMTVEPPTGFEQRLRRAVHEAQAEHAYTPARHADATRRRSLFPAWAGAALAAIALAAVFVVNRPGREQPLDFSPTDLATTVGDMAGKLTERWETKVAPAAQNFAADNPVQQELDAVYADGQKAVRFLAMNFLPTRQPQNG